MNQAVWMALAATVGTWLATAFGAGVVFFFKHTEKTRMNLLLGFSAGVMIAASFWSLLEPSVRAAEEYLSAPAWFVVCFGFLLGAFFMWLSDLLIRFFQNRSGDSARASEHPLNRIAMLILSITLHNFPEGLAIGVAFGALHAEGYPPDRVMSVITIAIGIGIQNFPEGAAVSLPMRREGCSRWRSFLVGQASGLVEPIGGILGALLVINMRSLLPFALSFAAGAMILVTVHELIPSCQLEQPDRSYRSTMGIIFGFALMMLLDIALG